MWSLWLPSGWLWHRGVGAGAGITMLRDLWEAHETAARPSRYPTPRMAGGPAGVSAREACGRPGDSDGEQRRAREAGEADGRGVRHLAGRSVAATGHAQAPADARALGRAVHRGHRRPGAGASPARPRRAAQPGWPAPWRRPDRLPRRNPVRADGLVPETSRRREGRDRPHGKATWRTCVRCTAWSWRSALLRLDEAGQVGQCHPGAGLVVGGGHAVGDSLVYDEDIGAAVGVGERGDRRYAVPGTDRPRQA